MAIGLESYYERVSKMNLVSLKKLEARANEEYVERCLKSLTLQELAKLIKHIRSESDRRAKE